MTIDEVIASLEADHARHDAFANDKRQLPETLHYHRGARDAFAVAISLLTQLTQPKEATP